MDKQINTQINIQINIHTNVTNASKVKANYNSFSYIYIQSSMWIIYIICKWCKWLFRLNARHTCINKYTIKKERSKMVVFLFYHFNHQNTRYAPDLLFLHIVRNFILCELCHTEYINHEENLTFNILSRMHTTYVTEYA